ncbi:MAG: hypothetical protein U0414_17930 [Polyangiaceae bacterium]
MASVPARFVSIASFALLACGSSSGASPSASASSSAAPRIAETGPAGSTSSPRASTVSEDKEFLGLTLPPMGKWKPTWNPEAKVAAWESADSLTGIVLRVVREKLDTVGDLEKAAPMMMQLGSAIAKVDEEKKTDKGWYAVVRMDADPTLVYVRAFDATTVVCSANNLGKSVSKEDAIKACESFEPKK